MKSKRKILNFYLFYFGLLSLIFFFVEKNHQCEGDGCLICLFSLIIHFTTNVLLIIKFIPIVVEKIYVLIVNSYSDISNETCVKEDNSSFSYTYNNIPNNLNLVSFGIKIQ